MDTRRRRGQALAALPGSVVSVPSGGGTVGQVPVLGQSGGYTWQAPSGGGQAPYYALISPSGDRTGATDANAINDALTGAAVRGGTVRLMPGQFYVNAELMMPNTGSYSVILEGSGRLATLIDEVSDLGAGKYALRGSSIGGGSSYNRIRAFTFGGPGAGSYSSPATQMYGLCGGSNFPPRT